MEKKTKETKPIGIRILNAVFSLVLVSSLLILYFSSYIALPIALACFSVVGLGAISVSIGEGILSIAMALVTAFLEGIALICLGIAAIFSVFG